MNGKTMQHQEFLNPKSMLTPGLAGSTTMFITNVLAAQFGLLPNFTGLVISFVFGLLVFASTTTVLWLRFVLYFLNSLLIFSVALGANQVGVRVASRSGAPAANIQGNLPSTLAMIQWGEPFFSNWLDGTVPRRTQLLASVGKLSDQEARGVLLVLGATKEELMSPKATLRGRATYVRSADQIGQIDTAIERASAVPWLPKPID